MIDLDELHDKMVSYRLVGFTKSDIGTIDALELIGRLEQAEKDAARYRWLRDLPDGSAHEEIGNYPGDMWDESIDEAMRCNK